MARPPKLPEGIDRETYDFLMRTGGQAAVDRFLGPRLEVSEVIQDGDNPFDWYGSDHRPDLMRYSWVQTEQAAERLKRQKFFKIDGDVRLRGMSGGIVMGRLLKDEVAYKRARQLRDYERRSGSKSKRQQVGDPSAQAQFSIGSRNTPAQVRRDEMEAA